MELLLLMELKFSGKDRCVKHITQNLD